MRTLILLFAALGLSHFVLADTNDDARTQAVRHYPVVVHAAYVDALGGAEYLQGRVLKFCAQPDEAGLRACREAWRRARQPYCTTEAFRFYGGPIDDENGPEGLMNSWPVDESWLESGAERRGIIEDETTYPEITVAVLRAANQKEGEKNVASGWHAIEFLLWGRDESAEGPGARPVTDFTTAPFAARRLAALAVLTQSMVEHLQYLVKAWEVREDGGNYEATFVQLNAGEAVKRMLTGLIFLSGQEMAGERLNVALETRDQEDEQSCFSDNTTQDMQDNLCGLRMVWEGSYESVFIAENDVSGPGLKVSCVALDPALAEAVDKALTTCTALAATLPTPFDQAVQGEDDSHGRRMYQEMRAELEILSGLFQDMADKMSLQIANGAAFYNG